MSDELAADARIYVASTDRRVVHTDRECRHLAEADVTAYERREYPDLPVCRSCAGAVEYGDHEPWKRVKALEDADPEELGLEPLVE